MCEDGPPSHFAIQKCVPCGSRKNWQMCV